MNKITRMHRGHIMTMHINHEVIGSGLTKVRIGKITCDTSPGDAYISFTLPVESVTERNADSLFERFADRLYNNIKRNGKNKERKGVARDQGEVQGSCTEGSGRTTNRCA